MSLERWVISLRLWEGKLAGGGRLTTLEHLLDLTGLGGWTQSLHWCFEAPQAPITVLNSSVQLVLVPPQPSFPCPPGGLHSPEGTASLTVLVAPRHFSGRHARARAHLFPAPCSRPSSRCPGGRRPLAPLLQPPAGRESAARGPSEG